MGVGLRPRTKVLDEPPDPTAHASEIYPDCQREEAIVAGNGLVMNPGRGPAAQSGVASGLRPTVATHLPVRPVTRMWIRRAATSASSLRTK